jgi:hypothetical protein
MPLKEMRNTLRTESASDREALRFMVSQARREAFSPPEAAVVDLSSDLTPEERRNSWREVMEAVG